MTTAPWSRLQADDPGLADAIESRFAAHLHHLLATIRPSGAPRISGTEVELGAGEVRIGMMPHAHKLRDVQRDARVEIHSAPLDTDLRAGDAKLAGVLCDVGPIGEPPGHAFTLQISSASLVRVDGDELVFTVWRPESGTRTVRRT